MQTPDTPQLSPIEKVLGNIDRLMQSCTSIQMKTAYRMALKELESIRPYERHYLRDVAEKAWDASFNSLQIGYSVDEKTGEVYPVFDSTEKQTYLNEKHPL